MRRILAVAVPVVLVIVIVVGAVLLLRRAPGPAVATAAQTLYEKECAVCHGSGGDGAGSAAYLLYPKPRDFTRGLFKVRSTLSGELPTDNDLFQTITQGMPGSAMPSFAHLSEEDRRSLVGVVKAFWPPFAERQPPQGITPPSPMPVSPETLARGKDVYARMACSPCHGETGRADGPSAATLKDEWGNDIRANDFTRGIYKGGARDEDIYLRFLTGMSGTPMPSFAGLISDEDIYALVHYVKSLAGGAADAVQPTRESLAVQRVASVPADPRDGGWASLPEVKLPLMLLYQRQESVRNVAVKAAHDGTSIAIRVEWEDAQPNAQFIRPQDFSDAVAVQFPLQDSADLITLTMGQHEVPVNIWHWKADHQVDVERRQDVEDVYPAMASDDYPFAKTLYARQNGKYIKTEETAGHKPVPATADNDPSYLSGWGAGNPMSSPDRSVAVDDLNAVGFGTLSPQPAKAQNVRGTGVWDNGMWRVVFVRALAGARSGDVRLAPGATVPAAFAVWEGQHADRDGQKSVTSWNLLSLAP
jgi:mono/diheme cytochrome c family protein